MNEIEIQLLSGERIDANAVRRILLDTIYEHSKDNSKPLMADNVIKAASKKFQAHTIAAQQAVLTIWHDFFRTGFLAPGFQFGNLELPYFCVTEKGRRSLENLSRDPSNPVGYLAFLKSLNLQDSIVLSYAEEAVNAYVNGCAKSAVVMIGCASERLVIMIRDDLSAGLTRQSRSVSNQLQDWRFKTVRDAITNELDSKKTIMPKKLRESYVSFWLSCTEQMRQHRNDAGHPESVEPVTDETVYANLILFPTFANLAIELGNWIRANYS